MDRRTPTLAIAIALGLAAAPLAPASGQVLCEKANHPGAFKLRAACKEGKEQQVADLGALPRVVGATGELSPIISTPGLVRLDGPVTSVEFETTAESSDVHITFSSRCALLTNVIGAVVDVTLFLDGVPIAPTDGVGGFCANPVALFAGSSTASRTVVVPDLAPGSHVFEVSANTSTDAAAGTLDEISTSIVLVAR